MLVLGACGQGPSAPSPRPASAEAPKLAPDEPCCCARFDGTVPLSCERVVAAACAPLDDPGLNERRACMTTTETKNLHDSYQTISETYSKHKAAGTLNTLTQEHEMEGSIVSFWAPTLQCVRACGDGVNGPDGRRSSPTSDARRA
ncbi:MAG: hypothetical protein IPO67_26585 [Deltaproteobacteria bacterium]|nr:hypothetical protein [Deltaproteobacteria bacterium]